MSKKRRNFTSEFKSKIIIEMFENGMSINEMASKYNLHPKTVQLWKKQFIENAILAFDKSSVVKEYKEEIDKLAKEKEQLAQKLGETIVEKEWLEKKLKSLDLSKKRELIDDKAQVQAKCGLSINKQLKLLGVSKTAYYYIKKESFSSNEKLKILNAIDKIYTDFPYYGTRRMKKALKKKGITAGRKLIKKAYEILGIEAIYPKKEQQKLI